MTAYSDEVARALPNADVTIGGIPFHYAVDDEHPYQRQTLPWKRQQIDTSTEPGEQTFSSYWVRDQDSWHRGAGINFYEPGSDPYTRYRYARGVGVDVWEPGDLTLLHVMERKKTATSGSVGVCSAVRNGVNGVYYTVDSGLGWCQTSGATDFAMGGIVAATEPVLAGSKILFGTTTGVAACTVNNEAATMAALWTVAAGAVVRPWWVKSRIIAARSNSIYELTLTGGSLPSPLYTHPDTNWEWTAVTETPDAILCAGRSNGYSAIYALTLATSGTAGSTPTLGPMAQVAELPPGEEIYSLKVYLGSFLALGTTHGVRIADIGTNGQVRYGPLTVESTYPVRCLAMNDSFVYAGIEDDLDGNSGCVRINLAEEITNYVNGISFAGSSTSSTLRFAWSYDVQISAGTQDKPITGIAFMGTTSDVVLGAQDNGVFVTSHTDYRDSGYLTSGRIRFGTAEQKLFPWAKARCDIPGTAKIDFSVIGEDGTEYYIDTYHGDISQDIDLSTIMPSAQAHVSVKLTLYSYAGSTPGPTENVETPTIQHLQVKALPKPALQREISYPLRLVDREESRSGTIHGYPGWAYARLAAVEDLQVSNVITTVRDNTTGEVFDATVEDVRVTRNTPPSRNGGNFGGVLQATVIKL